MKNSEHVRPDIRVKWLAGVGLVIMLYLMYSPVFLTDYLMNDEWNNIGSSKSLTEGATLAFFTTGRSLDGIYSSLVYKFVGYDPFRVQIVRFFNCSSVIILAAALFLFLDRRSRNTWFSFLVILLFFSQRSFQGVVAYSLDLTMAPAMGFSLLAFYVHFCSDSSRFPRGLRLAVAGLLLILAMQSMQTFAYVSMVPLTYLALPDWKNQRQKVLEFLLLASAVFVLSAVAYKVGLYYWHGLGREGYNLGEQNLEALAKHPFKVLLQAVNPFAYWGAFEIWSYPFPFHSILPLKDMKRHIAYLILIAWWLLVLWTVITEFRVHLSERRQVLFKWLTVLICLGFGAIFVITDSPLHIEEHRPHMTLIFAGVAIFCAAYCLQILASKHRFIMNPVVSTVAVICVVMTAFGAQAGVLRGYVNNRMKQFDFIRTELMTGNPLEVRNIIVVLPQWSRCVTEPCGSWVGHVTEGIQWHIRREGAYRYALSTVGISPEGKNIDFVQGRPKEIAADSVIIDWNKYAWARRAYLNRLHHVAPLQTSIRPTVPATSSAPVIDVWYGATQSFGQNGIPQQWVNILGTVYGKNAISSLDYSLNDGTFQRLTFGSQRGRLVEPGDFNIELDYASLNAGANKVVIKAIDSAGSESIQAVTVNYATGRTWSLPYSVDWSNVTKISDVAQVVDGKWQIQSDGSVRTMQVGYDRLLAIGDRNTWTSYEVTAELMVNSLDFYRGFGVGIATGWQGHSALQLGRGRPDQPRTGHVFTGLGWWANGIPGAPAGMSPALEIYCNTVARPDTVLATQRRSLTLGLKYMFKLRAEQNRVGGSRYSFKVWLASDPEPQSWDLQADGELNRGSILLVSHRADVSFGRVKVVPVP